jgi:2-phosphoglycerate kinase
MIKANISLSSFAGSAEIFEECSEVVSYLKNDTIYKLAGAEIPRGILLEGPPGTGKTLLAKAIASEADANFIAVAASEFVELFVGMGAAKIRGVFTMLREHCSAPPVKRGIRAFASLIIVGAEGCTARCPRYVRVCIIAWPTISSPLEKQIPCYVFETSLSRQHVVPTTRTTR